MTTISTPSLPRTYAKAFDIWQVPDYLRAHIQPGQWVYAGDKSNMGVWLGMRASGVSVVAWLGNGRRIGWASYRKSLRAYATAR